MFKLAVAIVLMAAISACSGAAINVEVPADVPSQAIPIGLDERAPVSLVRIARQAPSGEAGGSVAGSSALNFNGGLKLPVVGEIGGSFSGAAALAGAAGLGFNG